MTRSLRVARLYPEAMNLDGDMGNVRVLQRRAEWRGIAVEVLDVGPGPADLARCDLVFFGGGQDRDQSRIFEDFADHKRASLQRAVDEGTDGGAGVCGGYQLLEHAYVDTDGRELRGLSLLDLRSQAGSDRGMGNVVIESEPSLGLRPRTLVGFENHRGAPSWAAARRGHLPARLPAAQETRAGRLVVARGAAAPGGGGADAALQPLDDEAELWAHRQAERLARAERGRTAVRTGRLRALPPRGRHSEPTGYNPYRDTRICRGR